MRVIRESVGAVVPHDRTKDTQGEKGILTKYEVQFVTSLRCALYGM